MNTPISLLHMLNESVARFADRPAIWDPTPEGAYEVLTYDRLWREIRSVAGNLQGQGIGPGDYVGLIADGRAWWPIADFAIMSLGAITVPVYPSLPAGQVQYILNHAGVKGVLVQDGRQLQKLVEEAPRLPTVQFVAVLDDANEVDAMTADVTFSIHAFSAWRKQASRTTDWDDMWQGLTPDNVATIVYTSGTTGTPKGVILTHANLISNVMGTRSNIMLEPTDRSLSYLPLSHIFERTCGLYFILQAGASIAYSRGIAFITEDFRRMPPTLFTTVPRLLEKVQETVAGLVQSGPAWKRSLFEMAVSLGTAARVTHESYSRWQLTILDALLFRRIRQAFGGRLRAVVVGGAPLPTHVGEFFMAAGVIVAEGYGMTETSPVVSCNPIATVRLGTAGKVIPNVEVSIATDGEVLVRGPSVTQGYLHDDEATRELLDSDGWLHTGDIGELSEDGYLRITDRKKNLLVLSTGKKVTPAPIEGEILTSAFVDQVTLVGQGRKYVSAIVVPDEGRLQEWMQRKGLHAAKSEWPKIPAIAELLLAEVQLATKERAGFEQPKKVIVAREPFTVENQLLTPTLKVRSRSVVRVYEREIDALYADEAAAASGPS